MRRIQIQLPLLIDKIWKDARRERERDKFKLKRKIATV